VSTIRKLLFIAVFTVAVGAAAMGWSNSSAAGEQGGGDNFNYLPSVELNGVPFNCHFLEQNQIVTIEVESAPIVDPLWHFEQDVPGYTGNGYYTWRGPDYFVLPGIAVMSYPIRIVDDGDYRLRIRNFHDHPANDQQNDVWVRLDNGPWIKLFSSVSFEWTYVTAFDLGGGVEAIYRNVSAGDHTLELAARSFGFRMDRIAFYQPGADGEDPTLPQSPCVLSIE